MTRDSYGMAWRGRDDKCNILIQQFFHNSLYFL